MRINSDLSRGYVVQFTSHSHLLHILCVGNTMMKLLISLKWYPENSPGGKLPPWLELEFGRGLGLDLGLRGNFPWG